MLLLLALNQCLLDIPLIADLFLDFLIMLTANSCSGDSHLDVLSHTPVLHTNGRLKSFSTTQDCNLRSGEGSGAQTDCELQHLQEARKRDRGRKRN